MDDLQTRSTPYLYRLKTLSFILFVAILCVFHLAGLSLYMAAASFAYLMMATGFFLIQRGHLTQHIICMKTAMLVDLGIVLTLELSRDVIHTTMYTSLTLIQMIHIGSSSLSVALYVPVFLLGQLQLRKKRLNKESPLKSIHRFLGIVTFSFRSIGFVTMFLHYLKLNP